jgi:hypothetical protein
MASNLGRFDEKTGIMTSSERLISFREQVSSNVEIGKQSKKIQFDTQKLFQKSLPPVFGGEGRLLEQTLRCSRPWKERPS